MSICSTASRPPPAPEQLFHLRPAGQSVSTPPRPATPGPKSTEPPQSSTGNAPRRDHRRRSEAADPRVPPRPSAPGPSDFPSSAPRHKGKQYTPSGPKQNPPPHIPPHGAQDRRTRPDTAFPHPPPSQAHTPAPNRSAHRPEIHRRQRRHHHHRHSRLAMEVFLHGTDGPPVAES